MVTTTANFDEMLVPPDHISRSPNDTYYVSTSQVGTALSAFVGQFLKAALYLV